MNSVLYKSWLVLLVLQVLVVLLVFSDFLAGNFYFAYIDIGSDSYFQVVPYAVNLARSMAQEGFTGWSFQLGLGGPTTLFMGDLTNLLSQTVGVENVLPARIGFYILKIILGGGFFLLFVRHYVQRWEAAVISALAYSFCGFMVINGQWDIEATAFVFYPLVLWSVVRYLRLGDLLTLPLAIATSLAFGTFFVSLNVFLAFVCVAFLVCSDAPRAVLKRWIIGIFPLVALGHLLAAPYLLPVIAQLMDSSRVSGGQSLIQGILSKSMSISEWPLIVAQIGGLFHKDIFGIGSYYRGYFNYLEGPGFFIGITLFLLIPQLWSGDRSSKKLLLIGVAGVVAYFIFPIFRYAAMGFAAPYFRISTLWVSILVLVLAAKALDLVILQGVKIRLLALGLAIFSILLMTVISSSLGNAVWMGHVARIVALAVLSTIVLGLAHKQWLTLQRLPLALMLVVVVEMVVIARPSYIEGRALVSPKLRAFDDKTIPALATIRALDKGTFRIEKNFDSVSYADAMAQDYMGIKSYSLHSRGVVDFHIGTKLIPPASTVVNYSNWLPNAGSRFILNSLLGVKYFIATEALDWPGFIEIDNQSGLRIYRNDMALPFGIVQTQQVTKEALEKVSAKNPANATVFADAALINAAVVEKIIPGYGSTFDIEALAQSKSLSLEDLYFSPVTVLQKTGLQVDQFSSNHLTGRIAPNSAGILVFSIPFNSGWKLLVDGQETPVFRANFGMLAASVLAGQHSVELRFKTPGRSTGWLLGALGLGLSVILAVFRRRLTGTHSNQSVKPFC